MSADFESNLVLKKIYSNGCGHIILNRPSKYNALTFKMFEYLLFTLLNWRDNENIKFILFTSNCKKAFCTGGDVDELAESITNPIKQGFNVWQFLFVEYRLNLLIATYSKPIISLIDGYIMGGGCGIAINSRYCVITENAMCGMPECSIYWFPFSYYLHSNMPHSIGKYIGLTGVYLDYKDIIYTNLAKYYIKHRQIKQLEKELTTENNIVFNIEFILRRYTSQNIKELQTEKGKIEGMKDVIIDCFDGKEINDVINRLKYTSNNHYDLNIRKWSMDCYNKLLKTSPLSLKVTMKLIDENKYNVSISKHASTIFNVGARMSDKYNLHNGVKKWRKEKNKEIFKERFPYDLKHNDESSDLLDNGILSLYLELDARYSWKLKYDKESHILSIIDIKINDRPSALKIDDIVNEKTKSKL